MATQGQASWEKHFKGNGDITTTVNKDTLIYDVKNATKELGSIVAGTVIVFKSIKTYNPKPIIEFKVGNKVIKARIKFDFIQKPGIKTKFKTSDNEETIRNKALTPDGLGLGGKTIKKSEFLASANNSINKTTAISDTTKKFLIELLEKSATTTNSLSNVIDAISEKDKKIIAKDFGEIAGAWWFLNNYDKGKLQYIEYPARSNEPLVDYYALYSNKLKVKVSAKAGKGAAPALNPIWAEIDKKNFTGNDLKIKNFISLIVNNDGKKSIIEASKFYNAECYKIFAKIINKPNYTVQDIESWLSLHKSPKVLYDLLTKQYYSKIGRSVPLDSITKILAQDKNYSGIILSPMAYALMDEVNKNEQFVDFLTKVCNSLGVQQLYIDIKKNNFIYTLEDFAKSKFYFEYHSNAANPGANKIGFKMVH